MKVCPYGLEQLCLKDMLHCNTYKGASLPTVGNEVNTHRESLPAPGPV